MWSIWTASYARGHAEMSATEDYRWNHHRLVRILYNIQAQNMDAANYE
jgi:hypothetical protein